jgi:hypothetical protein
MLAQLGDYLANIDFLSGKVARAPAPGKTKAAGKRMQRRALPVQPPGVNGIGEQGSTELHSVEGPEHGVQLRFT